MEPNPILETSTDRRYYLQSLGLNAYTPMEPANLLIIKSLDDGWCDKDIVMLHACFQLLEDVIENEKLFEMTDWEQTEEFIQARQELQQLYDWWQIRKELTARDDFDMLDRSSYEKDTQQLMKLIELRHFLWT